LHLSTSIGNDLWALLCSPVNHLLIDVRGYACEMHEQQGDVLSLTWPGWLHERGWVEK
jgi:hypothetical protein